MSLVLAAHPLVAGQQPALQCCLQQSFFLLLLEVLQLPDSVWQLMLGVLVTLLLLLTQHQQKQLLRASLQLLLPLLVLLLLGWGLMQLHV